MKAGNKFLLLLALLLSTASLRAEEGGSTAVAESPQLQDAFLVVSEDPSVIAEAQKRVVEEANRTGTPINRVILEIPGQPALSPQQIAPLTADGESTFPNAAEGLADRMDAERDRQIAHYKKRVEMMVAARAYAVGGITGITMAVGAYHSGANPQTILASAAIGLAVGGKYSAFLQKYNTKNLAWQGTQSFFAVDPKNRPASTTVRIIKQMAVPIGLATLMHTSKAIADLAPGVDFKTFWTDPSMLKGVGLMAANSAWFQYPWTRNNQEKTKAEKEAAGDDSVGIARAEHNSGRRTLSLSLLLSVTNSLQLGGMGGIGTAISATVGAAGHVYRGVSALAKANNAEGNTAERGLASNTDGPEVESPKKGLSSKVGNVCSASYAALKAVATRTLASARNP
jgi:hypothetical protein